MTPEEFIVEYVEPAFMLWHDDPNSSLKAVCAVSQFDILAEVVAHYDAGRELTRADISAWREALRKREPALGRVQDGHDSHKHGRLTRRSANTISQGQRPYQSAGTGFFGDDGFEGDPLGETDTSILLNDGTPLPIGEMLSDAKAAWQREFIRMNLPAWE